MADSTFTGAEIRLLLSILRNLQGDLKADWSAVAAENNYKNASVGHQRWTQIRRKKIEKTGRESAMRAGKVAKKPPTKRVPNPSKVCKEQVDSRDSASDGGPGYGARFKDVTERGSRVGLEGMMDHEGGADADADADPMPADGSDEERFNTQSEQDA